MARFAMFVLRALYKEKKIRIYPDNILFSNYFENCS